MTAVGGESNLNDLLFRVEGFFYFLLGNGYGINLGESSIIQIILGLFYFIILFIIIIRKLSQDILMILEFYSKKSKKCLR